LIALSGALRARAVQRKVAQDAKEIEGIRELAAVSVVRHAGSGNGARERRGRDVARRNFKRFSLRCFASFAPAR
jgi:hypothetical protein